MCDNRCGDVWNKGNIFSSVSRGIKQQTKSCNTETMYLILHFLFFFSLQKEDTVHVKVETDNSDADMAIMPLYNILLNCCTHAVDCSVCVFVLTSDIPVPKQHAVHFI